MERNLGVHPFGVDESLQWCGNNVLLLGILAARPRTAASTNARITAISAACISATAATGTAAAVCVAHRAVLSLQRPLVCVVHAAGIHGHRQVAAGTGVIVQLETLLRMIVAQQFAIRVEDDAVVATAASHPDGNSGRLQATARLAGRGVSRLRFALPNDQADVRPL